MIDYILHIVMYSFIGVFFYSLTETYLSFIRGKDNSNASLIQSIKEDKQAHEMQMEALKREQDRLFETMLNSIEKMRENNKRLIADIQKVTSSVKSLNNA
jgi:SMC interacting uncharacterized protein involved in chromosome segregation